MMEAEYGVGIKNRFAFLDGEEDNDEESSYTAPAPSIPVSKVSGSSDKKALESKSNGRAAEPKTVASANTKGNPKEKVVKGKGQAVASDDRRGPRENGGQERSSREGPPSRGRFQRDNYRRGEPNRRNYGTGRGGDFRENRNEVSNEETNSGDSKGDDGEEKNGVTEDDNDAQKPDDAQQDETENSKAEEKTLTLAEWKALQAPREKPKFNIRKPGEGELTGKLEKLVLKKREDDIGDQDEEYEIDEVYYPQRAGKLKLVADVGFTTGYQKRRGGGKFGASAKSGGGDGHGRDGNLNSEQKNNFSDRPRGRTRFGPRGDHQRPAQAPRIDDAFDFPQLG